MGICEWKDRVLFSHVQNKKELRLRMLIEYLEEEDRGTNRPNKRKPYQAKEIIKQISESESKSVSVTASRESGSRSEESSSSESSSGEFESE